MIGAIAGPVCALWVDLMEYLRIDDPVGAVAVHGAAGIWGTLSLGLFATGQYGAPTPTGADTSAGALVTGLFYVAAQTSSSARRSAAPPSAARSSSRRWP